MQYRSISIRYTNEKCMHVDTAIAYPACNKYLLYPDNQHKPVFWLYHTCFCSNNDNLGCMINYNKVEVVLP